MKKLVFLTVCLVAFAANGFSQRGYKGEQGVSSVGVIMGHAVSSKAFTIGADYRYNVKDRIRLAPSVLYTMKNSGDISTIYANADAHYLTRITNEITIYPIGGLGVSMRKFENYIGLDDIDDIGDIEDLLGGKIKSETKTRVGLNLGFGGETRVTKDIVVGAEFRYHLTTERFYDQAMLLARAAYYF